jgi:hypothetical protein
MSQMELELARQALTECDAIVDRLHKMCCEPDRSPRMLAIKESIESARHDIDSVGENAGATNDVLAALVEIGGDLGRLQVECCAPARMPLYADALDRLTTTQISINAAVGQGH